MKRRNFLGAAAGLAALTAVPLSAHDLPEDVPRDNFTYRGFQVRWCGWREPMNQTVMFGVWMAVPHEAFLQEDNDSLKYWVSCTLGRCAQYRAFDVFDTTFDKDHGVYLSQLSGEGIKAVAKRQALDRLLAAIA